MLTIEFKEHFRARQAEWWLSMICAGCGFATLADPTSFALNPTLTTLTSAPILGFIHLDMMAWGWGMLGLGGISLIALARNGGWRRSPIIRAFCAGARGLLWAQIFAAFTSGDVASWGPVIMFVFGIAELYNARSATTDVVFQRRADRASSVVVA